MKLKDAMEVLESMTGEGRLEWADKERTTAVIYWRKPEEWANIIYEWVSSTHGDLVNGLADDDDAQIDSTGQKNSVLTLYEISRGDLTTLQGENPANQVCAAEMACLRTSAEFHGMEPTVLRKSLDILVKRGSAQVFGTTSEEMGVKFF